MGSAAIAKERLTKMTKGLARLSWPEWSRRVNELLSVGGYSMKDFPQYSFKSYYLAGVPSGTVAVTVLRSECGKEVKVDSKGR